MPVHVQVDEVPWVERTTGVSRTDLVGHHSGEVLQVGQIGVELIHTPGHTPGSQCFLVDGRLVAGDTLFLEGCGRTDFPGSDPLAMYESIHTRLARVPDDAILFPGHLYSADPSASMGDTRRWNYVFRPRSARGVDGHVRPVTPAGESDRGQHGRRGRRVAGRLAVPSRRCAPRASKGRSRWSETSATCPTTGPRFPSRCWPGRGHPRRRCWRTSGARSELRVHEVLGRRAVRLDVEGRKVELDDGTVLDGDAIVVATGARRAGFPGTEALGQGDGLFTLRTLDDSVALAGGGDRGQSRPGRHHRRRVHRRRGGVDLRRAGLLASPCSRRWTSRCATCSGPMIGAHCGSLHAANGVELRTGVAVAGIRRADRSGSRARGRTVIDLAEGEPLPADVVVVGIGVVPATDWLDRLRADTRERRRVRRPALRRGRHRLGRATSARWNWRHDGGEELIRIEHWQVAAEAGVAAARSIAGRSLRRTVVRPRPVLLVRPVRHPLPGAREPAWRRRGGDHRGHRSRKESSSRCSADRAACVPSWPSASPGN